MTQDEAANILWWASKRHYPGDQMDITAEDIEAFDMAIPALRGPEPDPDTGLMPCGCGRAMRVDCYPGNHGLADAYQVTCYGCNVGTLPMRSAGKAQVAWNRAMGWRVEG